MIEKAYFYKKTLEKLNSLNWNQKRLFIQKKKDTQYNGSLHCASYKEMKV